MAKGINLSDKIPFKVDGDNTVWYLGLIPSDVFAKISMESEDIQSAFKLLQLTLRGWDNFDVDYTTEKLTVLDEEFDAVPMSVIRRIPLRFINALALQSMKINSGLEEEERKN